MPRSDGVFSLNQRRLTIYSFVYRGFAAALTFINSAVAARFLLPADRGDYQTMVTYASSGQAFSGGFSNYFSRSLPRRPEDRDQIVQMGNFVMFLFSICIWLISLGIVWLANPTPVVTFALIGTPLTFLFGYGSRLLNSLQEISWLNRVNIAQAVVFLVTYLAYIILQYHHAKNAVRLEWTFRLWLLSWVVTVVLTLFVLYRKLGSSETLKWRWSTFEWRGLRSFGTWSSLALLSGYINYRIDFWMLNIVTRDKILVSVYGIAVVAAEILNTLTQSISTMVFQRVTASNSNDAGAITESATRQTLITSFAMALVLSAMMPILMDIYGWHKYGGAIGPFYILLPGLIMKASANVISQYFNNSQGKPFTLLVVNCIVIAFNAVICLFAIPYIGIYGAAISASISYFFEMVLYVSWYHRVSGRQGRNLWRLQAGDFQPYLDVLLGVRRRVLRRG